MIDPDVLAPRIPRLGTITTGYGVEATSQAGNAYSRPTRADAFVFHTNDPEVANAVQMALGGDLSTDSPTWGYDVVTDARRLEVDLLPAGIRQNLEQWRAAQVARRCDGVTTSTLDGKRVSQPCVCEAEMAQGRERACDPHTTMPLLVDLDLERFGVWEVKSTAWGTARNVAGVRDALTMAGVTSGRVPAIVTMVDRDVRDAQNRVHTVAEIEVAIASSIHSLAAISSGAPALVGTPGSAGELGPGSERDELLARLKALRDEARDLGLREQLGRDWGERHGDVAPSEVSDDALSDWVDHVEDLVADHRDAGEGGSGSPESAVTPPGDSSPPPMPPPPPDEA